ncbi:Gfo/Idh/MocA family protein [Alistipes sp.]|uniref:Gfo/Idh/MocA family protein n=1 Tax=Alistipes sp. TaxID=1872444 RepID=UPI003A865E6A
MDAKQTVRWGIVGCGDVCERKSGPPMYLTEHSELVAVMRRDGEKAADFARRHGVGRYYTDAAELIADPEVDIVYVATPPASHKELAIRALEAGKPVYVEKPMAMNHAECREMIAAAERARQPLFVAYYRRALPYFRRVKELLDDGRIGTPQQVEVRYLRPAGPEDRDPQHLPWRLRRDVGGEGYFYDMAPHTLDLLDFLFGAVASARGVHRNLGGLYEVADTVTATLQFQSGVVGSGLWSFVAPPEEREDSVLITGSRGTLRFATFDFQPIELITPEGSEHFTIDPPQYIQGPMIRTIVDQLRGVGRCPSDGYSAARTSWVMDQIMKQ